MACYAPHRGEKTTGAANPSWKGGISTRVYRKSLKDACERCGSTRHLCVHHRDANRGNAAPDNLETLCTSCHRKHHAPDRRLPPRKYPAKPCAWCATRFQPYTAEMRFCSKSCAMFARHNSP